MSRGTDRYWSAALLGFLIVAPFAFLPALEHNASAVRTLKKETADSSSAFSTSLEIGYGGDAHRTAPWDIDLECSYQLSKSWQIGAGLEAYAKGLTFSHLGDQAQASAELQWSMSALDDSDWDFYCLLRVAGPGIASRQGADVIPAVTIGYVATDALSLNLSLGDWVVTSQTEGQTRNSFFAQFSADLDTGWPFSGEDGFRAAFSIEESDQIDDRTPLVSMEVGYEVQWRKTTTFNIGLGHDFSSPYERHSMYLKASIQWRL